MLVAKLGSDVLLLVAGFLSLAPGNCELESNNWSSPQIVDTWLSNTIDLFKLIRGESSDR